MKNLKLLFSVIFAFVALLLALLYGAFIAESDASKEVSRATAARYASYLLADELRQSSDDLTRLARTYVVSADPKWEEQYWAVLDIRNGKKPRPQAYNRIYWDFLAADSQAPRGNGDAVPLLSLMKEAGFTETELGKLAEAERNSNGLVKVETIAMNAVKGQFEDGNGGFTVKGQPDLAKARSLMHDAAYHQYKAQIMKPVDEFFVLLDQRTQRVVAAAEERRAVYQKVVIGLSVLLTLSLLLALVLAYRQMQGRMSAQQAAEAGEQRASAENEQLNSSVVSILEAVHQLSQRDLTVRAPVTQDVIGTVSDSINSLTDETTKVLKSVSKIASQVAEASGNVRSQAALVSKTAEDERVSVDQMVISLAEATQTMNRVSALAEQTNVSAAQATQATDTALQTVNGTVKGMESIRETIAETEKRIKRLGERSQEISGIVNLINTISERTHVLALNASMQAAVAGEAGRGFAVVAEEVQRLAESSRNATQQIATLVNNIQLETNETISTVNRTIGQVVEGSELAQKAGEQMRRTQDITGQLVAQVKRIGDASEEQKATSVNLLAAAKRIGESTQRTGDQILAQNQETESLAQSAIRLLESVNVFKLPQAA